MPVLLSSCFVSLISTFWKYPERFNAVMKLATEFTDAAAPSIERLFPFLVIVISHRFSVRETVLAISSSNSCAPVRSRCNCSMVATRCVKIFFWASNVSTCCFTCSKSAFCACSCLMRVFSSLSCFCQERYRRNNASTPSAAPAPTKTSRSEEHTSELQSPDHLVCRLLLEKKKKRSKGTVFIHTHTLQECDDIV